MGISRKNARYKHQPCQKDGCCPGAVTDQMGFILLMGFKILLFGKLDWRRLKTKEQYIWIALKKSFSTNSGSFKMVNFHLSSPTDAFLPPAGTHKTKPRLASGFATLLIYLLVVQWELGVGYAMAEPWGCTEVLLDSLSPNSARFQVALKTRCSEVKYPRNDLILSGTPMATPNTTPMQPATAKLGCRSPLMRPPLQQTLHACPLHPMNDNTTALPRHDQAVIQGSKSMRLAWKGIVGDSPRHVRLKVTHCSLRAENGLTIGHHAFYLPLQLGGPVNSHLYSGANANHRLPLIARYRYCWPITLATHITASPSAVLQAQHQHNVACSSNEPTPCKNNGLTGAEGSGCAFLVRTIRASHTSNHTSWLHSHLDFRSTTAVATALNNSEDGTNTGTFQLVSMISALGLSHTFYRYVLRHAVVLIWSCISLGCALFAQHSQNRGGI